MANDHPRIRVGVVGVRRGRTFMNQAPAAGMELVAICDTWEEKLREVNAKYNVATYTDYDAFLEHDMDAVVTANYFHQHAPLAIKALRAGKHVMSECAACHTLAEGVALCREVERSGLIYMLAENYPYTAANLELHRLYQAGAIGEVMYAEGEYNHPMKREDWMRISPGLRHWRNNLAATYYCTHALAPLMHITDTMPVSVNALAIPWAKPDPLSVRRQDAGAVTLCRMGNGAVFRLFGINVPGHSIWYRLHGSRGLAELTRGGGYWGPGHVRLAHDPWDVLPGEEEERIYAPEFPAWAQRAAEAGHGGGDFFTSYLFAEAIRTGEQPYLNVYRGVAMSVVGIQAWKSCLENGQPYEIPDFTDEKARALHENDHWSPFPEDAGPGQPFPSIRGDIQSTPEAIAYARQLWEEQLGFREQD
ncbi:MAG: Gfo/Idh/MocA family protein [Limnochordia bacterium]|jgi:predicted dehydrogenase